MYLSTCRYRRSRELISTKPKVILKAVHSKKRSRYFASSVSRSGREVIIPTNQTSSLIYQEPEIDTTPSPH